jgi:hypothetical protein
MDLDEEAVQISRDCSPHRHRKAREVGLILISEDPRLLRAMAIPATECFSRAAANVPEARRKLTKDVNFNGTNLRSPLESPKVPKKRTQKASQKGREMCSEHAKKHKQSERATPKGQIREVPAKLALRSIPSRRRGRGVLAKLSAGNQIALRYIRWISLDLRQLLIFSAICCYRR